MLLSILLLFIYLFIVLALRLWTSYIISYTYIYIYISVHFLIFLHSSSTFLSSSLILSISFTISIPSPPSSISSIPCSLFLSLHSLSTSQKSSSVSPHILHFLFCCSFQYSHALISFPHLYLAIIFLCLVVILLFKYCALSSFTIIW